MFWRIFCWLLGCRPKPQIKTKQPSLPSHGPWWVRYNMATMLENLSRRSCHLLGWVLGTLGAQLLIIMFSEKRALRIESRKARGLQTGSEEAKGDAPGIRRMYSAYTFLQEAVSPIRVSSRFSRGLGLRPLKAIPMKPAQGMGTVFIGKKGRSTRSY